jgi:hypothetical protein
LPHRLRQAFQDGEEPASPLGVARGAGVDVESGLRRLRTDVQRGASLEASRGDGPPEASRSPLHTLRSRRSASTDSWQLDPTAGSLIRQLTVAFTQTPWDQCYDFVNIFVIKIPNMYVVPLNISVFNFLNFL